jgi:hypothetical protein
MDSQLALAFSVYSNPGVNAVLLGSGVSRSANIPTGWEIIEDLISKVAKMQKSIMSSSPADWYQSTFNREPAYADLLDQLAKTPSERRGLLNNYFEPNETEREAGEKLPTDAHRAIARLVALGFVRVILTTNFDRLMETALEKEGLFHRLLPHRVVRQVRCLWPMNIVQSSNFMATIEIRI